MRKIQRMAFRIGPASSHAFQRSPSIGTRGLALTKLAGLRFLE
jgi:hypothetical protein